MTGATIEIRDERAGDEAVIRAVNDAAFGQPDESRMVDAIRAARHEAISLVAVSDHTIVGHILFTPVTIDGAASPVRAAGLAPMAVLPPHQRHGIGSRLVHAGLSRCRDRGYSAVVVLGHPAFYPRFGFDRASAFGLTCEFEVPDDAFMVAELSPGSLSGVTGVVKYLAEFGA